MLSARLATRRAKPNNTLFLDRSEIIAFLEEYPVKELPGIGYSIENKLKARNISTCGSILAHDLEFIKKIVGDKVGTTLFEFCRGIDCTNSF